MLHDPPSPFDFESKEYNVSKGIKNVGAGVITEVDRLKAAKQILLGLAVLYIFTLVAYVAFPERGNNLLEIAKMIFPQIATLIIVYYFKDNRAGS